MFDKVIYLDSIENIQKCEGERDQEMQIRKLLGLGNRDYGTAGHKY